LELYIAFAAGQTAIFRCYATGEPRPTVAWSRDDARPITAGVRQYVDTADGSVVLEWDNARSADSGVFTVTASNEWGSCTASASLLVESISQDAGPAPLEDMYATVPRSLPDSLR